MRLPYRPLFIVLALSLLWPVFSGAAAQVRVKDVATFQSVRENKLIGYGLVVGLPGTGDRLTNTVFTEVSLRSMLERLGVSVPPEDLRTRNVAAVMVTASLPAYARNGSTLDVSVSALGDASSLRGGTLLATPLVAADGQVYAVAQGVIVVSGFAAQGQAASITKGVPTAAKIANGAVVERELGFDLDALTTLRMRLRNPDFTTAIRIADTINDEYDADIAVPADLATVELAVPAQFEGKVARFLGSVENLTVTPDQLARVVIDESSGTIVIGANVRISEVAVTQGSITIEVQETPLVSQPAPFSRGGETTVVPRTNVDVDEEEEARFAVLEDAPTLQDLVNGLNTLGVGPRDIISVLQAIKAAGALHAELVIE